MVRQNAALFLAGTAFIYGIYFTPSPVKIKKISGDYFRFWQIVARKQAVKFGRLFPFLANSRPKNSHPYGECVARRAAVMRIGGRLEVAHGNIFIL
jgi:hypothetical protein